jgi:hypothetical protein
METTEHKPQAVSPELAPPAESESQIAAKEQELIAVATRDS